jgi:HAD superfamily hydrolase (TIGR01509 family)
MIRGMIFDFDGTLFDSMFIWDTAGDRYLRSIGKEPEVDLQKALKPMSLLQAAGYLREKYRIPLSVEEIAEGVNRTVEDFYIHRVEPKPGVIAFLEELHRRNIRMCIATATDRYLVEAALRRCKMRRFFCEIFTCTEVGSGKDSPEIFREAMEYMKTERDATAVVEDAYHAAFTAKQDGFAVVGVYDPHEDRQQALLSLADTYISDYSDLTGFWRFASAE